MHFLKRTRWVWIGVIFIAALWVITQFAQRGDCIGDFAYNPHPAMPQTDFTALEVITAENAHRLTQLGSINGSLTNDQGWSSGSGVTFSADGTQLAVSNYVSIRGDYAATQIFDVNQTELGCRVAMDGGWNSPHGFPFFVAFSQSGDLAIVSHSANGVSRYIVWELGRGMLFPASTMLIEAEFAEFVSFPDEEYISFVPVGETERSLWSTTTQQSVTDVPYPLSQAIEFSADHSLFVTINRAEGLIVWEYPAQSQQLFIEIAPEDRERVVPIQNVLFAGDNEWLIVDFFSQHPQIWDITSGQLDPEIQRCFEYILPGLNDWLPCSMTRPVLNTTDDRTTELVYAGAFQALNLTNMLYIATDEGESILFDLSNGQEAHLYDLSSEEPIFSFETDFSVSRAYFSPDGRLVVLEISNRGPRWIELWGIPPSLEDISEENNQWQSGQLQ